MKNRPPLLIWTPCLLRIRKFGDPLFIWDPPPVYSAGERAGEMDSFISFLSDRSSQYFLSLSTKNIVTSSLVSKINGWVRINGEGGGWMF